MAFIKLIKRSLTNFHHLDLFYRQSKLPLTIQQISLNFLQFKISLIETITKNSFTIKNTFEFFKKICEQNSENCKTGLDVKSLFINIPLEETITVCCDSLYKKQEFLCIISKNQFKKLLKAALSNNYFLFDGIIYQQVDGIVMDSALCTSLAKALLAHDEQIWLSDCPDEFKHVYYKIYMDDIFVLFGSRHHLGKFDEYFNTKYANIKFTDEK